MIEAIGLVVAAGCLRRPAAFLADEAVATMSTGRPIPLPLTLLVAVFSALVALAVSGGMHMGHDHDHAHGITVHVTHRSARP